MTEAQVSMYPMVALIRVAEIQLGKMLQPAPSLSFDRETAYLRAGSLSSLGDGDELPRMWCSPSDIQKYSLRQGDLLVAEGGDVGRTEFAPELSEPTVIQNSLHRVRTSSNDIRFLRYSIENIYNSGWLDVVCNKSTFGHLTVDKLSSLQIPRPTFAVQRAIADYLDAETARIDALIIKKQRMVELLEERLIAAAREMMGNHERYQLRRVVEAVKTGATPSSGDYGPADEVNDGIDWFAPGDFEAHLDLGQATRRVGHGAMSGGEVPVFQPGSVLVVGVGATTGRVAFATSICSSNQQVTALFPSKKVVGRFLAWQLWARRDEIRDTAPFSTLPIISNDFIKSLGVSIPTHEEQIGIADRLDDMATRVKQLGDSIHKQMTALTERRQALITAAVTGRLDIPEVAHGNH